jgi:hypothetical protein
MGDTTYKKTLVKLVHNRDQTELTELTEFFSVGGEAEDEGVFSGTRGRVRSLGVETALPGFRKFIRGGRTGFVSGRSRRALFNCPLTDSELTALPEV